MAVQLNNGGTNGQVFFDGSGSPFSSSGSNAVTMAAWVYRDTESASANEYVAACYQNSATFGGGEGFRCGTDDNWRTYNQANGDVVLTAAPTGSWFYLAFTTIDLFSGKAYYGSTAGSLTENASGTAGVNTTLGYLYLGRFNDGGNPFKGRIAHFRCWKRVLTLANLNAESSSATMVDSTNAYLAWELADGSGTTASDSTGNGRAGTLSGTTAWVAGPTLTPAINYLHLPGSRGANGGFIELGL